MLRNMVIGKCKYLIGPGSETTCTLLVEVGFIFVRTYGCRVVRLCSRGGCLESLHWKERESCMGDLVRIRVC
jgi:hypothetical protein